MRTNSILVIEPAKSWARLQAANKEWFLLDLHRRGLKGAALELITTDGHK
jgi:hypothetical protein